MAMMDAQTIFTANADGDSQTITGSTTVASDYALDLQAATCLGGDRSPNALYVLSKIIAKDTGGTTPSLTITLVAADDEAFDVNKITVCSTATFANAALSNGQLIRLPIPLHAKRQWYRVEYLLGAADNQYTVQSELAVDQFTPVFTDGTITP